MKDLVRNPLGIVALFISLIYAFASLLLGATVVSLTAEERYPLIIFIILFPVVVLGVFYRLVSSHHGKLYAPGDYKDDQSFLRTLSPQEWQEKLDLEVAEALPDNQPAEAEPATPEPLTAPPGTESAFATDTRRANISRLYDDIRTIEAAALAYLELQYGSIEARQVALVNTDVTFDALLKSNGKLTFAEVKILRTPSLSLGALDRVLYNAVVADRFFKGRFKLVLLVVYRFEKVGLSKVESVWRRRIERCPANIELMFVPASEISSEPAAQLEKFQPASPTSGR